MKNIFKGDWIFCLILGMAYFVIFLSQENPPRDIVISGQIFFCTALILSKIGWKL